MRVEQADKMTVQEMIDFGVNMIVQQGGTCMSRACDPGELGNCLYGNSEGRHCFIGWFLDEHNYDLMIFIGDVEKLVNTYIGYSSPIPRNIIDNVELFSYLQKFHDKDSYRHRESILKSLVGKFPQYNFSNPNFQVWMNMSGEA